jgi:putative serine protease PepD
VSAGAPGEPEEPRRSRRLSLRTGLSLLAVALSAVALGVALTAGGSDETVEATPADDATAVDVAQPSDGDTGADDTAASVYRTAAAGVVEIGAGGAGAFGDGGGALGTGFVIDDEGHVVTNEHVISGAAAIVVTFADGSEASAELVGTDPSTDIALLKVDVPAAELEPLELGSSGGLVVGQEVYAIGNPYGLERTLTAGIVSALDRQIQAPNGYTISGAIQTDAAINSGNSGGPLLDEGGRVVGVTAQIESQTGGNVGIGYAIPIDLVKSVVEELQSSGSVAHGYLGVTVEPAPDSGDGASIVEVHPGTPAEDAGLEPGDRVVAADGQPIDSPEELTGLIGSKEPGDEVELELVRDGETETITVTLGERPAEAQG